MTNRKLIKIITEQANRMAVAHDLPPVNPEGIIDRGDGVYILGEYCATLAQLFFDSYDGNFAFFDDLCNLSAAVAQHAGDGFFENETTVSAQWISNG